MISIKDKLVFNFSQITVKTDKKGRKILPLRPFKNYYKEKKDYPQETYGDQQYNKNMIQFSKKLQFNDLKKDQKPNQGRAWKGSELMVKSNEDLHKLYLVVQKEITAIKSDNQYIKRNQGNLDKDCSLQKCQITVKRIKAELAQRSAIRQKYWSYLENQYIRKMRSKYNKEKRTLAKINKNEIWTPEITHELLRLKFIELQKKKDNLDYLDKYIKKRKERLEYNKKLYKKYDYKLKTKEQIEEMSFEDSAKQQIDLQIPHISQIELLAQHVKNWKQLNLKQRKTLLGFINARRANSFKQEFIKELNLLAQKIKYEEEHGTFDQKKQQISEQKDI